MGVLFSIAYLFIIPKSKRGHYYEKTVICIHFSMCVGYLPFPVSAAGKCRNRKLLHIYRVQRPGDNHRIPGWMQVHYRLQFDENGYPRMYVFENCKAFIRTIPLMMFSDTKPEDLDTDLEDHVADEVRYMCMSRPITPIIPQKRDMIISDPLNQYTQAQLRRGYK